MGRANLLTGCLDGSPSMATALAVAEGIVMVIANTPDAEPTAVDAENSIR